VSRGMYLLWATTVDANSWNVRSLLLRVGLCRQPIPRNCAHREESYHTLFAAVERRQCAMSAGCSWLPGGRVSHDRNVGLAAALAHQHIGLDKHDGSSAI